jgi:hypothetical protein
VRSSSHRTPLIDLISHLLPLTRPSRFTAFAKQPRASTVSVGDATVVFKCYGYIADYFETKGEWATAVAFHQKCLGVVCSVHVPVVTHT